MNIIDFRIDSKITIKTKKMKVKARADLLKSCYFSLHSIYKNKVRYTKFYRDEETDMTYIILEIPYNSRVFFAEVMQGEELFKMFNFTKVIEINLTKKIGKWYELEYSNE